VGDEGNDHDTLARGASVGRYVIIELVGRGGMGAVYKAYDPDLDRKLAIKILRSGGSSARALERQARLQREAQALAKLSHPNVVAIHDVGVLDGQVFVVMDFIEGQTLRAWIGESGRPWRETIATFAQAGRGLAAAHAAGLIHRDFKPANVLVGGDGRVQVLDFGLARARGSAGPEPALNAEEMQSTADDTGMSSSLSNPLTRVGAVLGTPAYMAPEQHSGEATDTYTDQFSFCVALYEALYGESPFTGETLAARATSVTEGWIREAPRGTSVPGWLRRVLLRGLSTAPGDRYPTINALLAALEKDPARARRRWLAAAGSLLAVAATAWAFGSRAPERSVCGGAKQRVEEVWNDDRREAVRAAFVRTERPYADKILQSVGDVIDGYARTWQTMHTETCEATHVRHEQSAELLDLRMACLDRRRQELRALVDTFVDADSEVVENALRAAHGLGGIDECADARALRARFPTPEDPKLRARVVELEGSIAQIGALHRTGKYADALSRAREAVDEARPLDHPPLLARVLFELGVALEASGQAVEAEAVLIEAAAAAEVSEDDRLLSEIRTLLVMVTGDRLRHHREGHVWVELARATIRKLGDDNSRLSALENNLALLLDSEGKYKEELEHKQRALSLLESVEAPDPLRLAGIHNNLAATLGQLGKYEEGLQHAAQALAIYERNLGPNHPRAAIAHATTALVHDYRGKYAEALPLHEKALSILEAAVDKDSPRVAELLNNLAICAIQLGDVKRGEASFRRVLEIRERALGSDHLDVAQALGNLAGVLRMQGRASDALPHTRRALEIRERALAPDHPDVAVSLGGLANTLEDLGQYSESVSLRERAIGIVEKTFGTGHPEIVIDLGNLTFTYLRAGQRRKALEPAARAVAIVEAHEAEPDVEAFARIALAKALLQNGRDSSRARSLVEQAAADLGDLPAPGERELMVEIVREQHWGAKLLARVSTPASEPSVSAE
jgi:tetratricopeptide (TPR) repeat protein